LKKFSKAEPELFRTAGWHKITSVRLYSAATVIIT
jgi:hypothetical protein